MCRRFHSEAGLRLGSILRWAGVYLWISVVNLWSIFERNCPFSWFGTTGCLVCHGWIYKFPQVNLAAHSYSTATIGELTMNHGISCESFKYEIFWLPWRYIAQSSAKSKNFQGRSTGSQAKGICLSLIISAVVHEQPSFYESSVKSLRIEWKVFLLKKIVQIEFLC